MDKKLSAPPGVLPLDPAGGSAPDLRLGSRFARSPWSAVPFCRILDPPLEGKGKETGEEKAR